MLGVQSHISDPKASYQQTTYLILKDTNENASDKLRKFENCLIIFHIPKICF